MPHPTSAPPLPPNVDLIIFDGLCHLCDGSVSFIIRRDPRNRFRFAPLQSEIARQILTQHHLDTDVLSTIVLIENGVAYTKSTAALRIARRLVGLYPLLYPLILIPAPIRDLFYDFVAKNRYRFFGKRAACRIPSPDDIARFIGPSHSSAISPSSF